MKRFLSTLLPLIVAFSVSGCGKGCGSGSDGGKTPKKPDVKKQRFLDADAPSVQPLIPSAISVWIQAEKKAGALAELMTRLPGQTGMWPPKHSGVEAFLLRNRHWYTPIEDLRDYVEAFRTGKRPAPPKPIAPPAPLQQLKYRADFRDAGTVQRNPLAELVAKGGRGNLILWYPVREVRERLLHGYAGLWRGIIEFRKSIGGTGPPLGGTPSIFLGAVSAVDAAALKGIPDGFVRVVTRDEWLGKAGGERKERSLLLRKIGIGTAVQPKASHLPLAWTTFFHSPENDDVVFLVPKGTGLATRSIDRCVESLTGVVNQGGEAWLLISLPLAQKYTPGRY